MTTDPGRAEDRDPSYGWVIVGGLSVTEIISWGVVYYSFAVFLGPMRRELGLSTVEVTGAFSLALLVAAVAGIAVGRHLDRASPRLLMTAGSVLAALLVVAWSQVDSALALYLVWAGLGLAMAAILYEPAFVVLTKWFERRRYQAITALTLAAALASPIFSPLAEHLNDSYGWRDALLILACVLATITIPVHALLLRPAPAQTAELSSPPPALRYRDLDLRFWLLCAAFTVSTFAAAAMVVHLIALLIEDGRTAGFAALAAGALGLAQLPGRIVFGTFSTRIDAARAASAVIALGTVGLIVLLVSHSLAAVWVFVLLMGMSNGMVILVRATALGDIYGAQSYGAIAGRMAAFTTAARAVAPFGAAALAVLPGGYDTMVAVLAVLTGLASAAAWAAARPQALLTAGSRS